MRPPWRQRWTQEETELLRESIPKYGYDKTVERFKARGWYRSRNALKMRARQEGVSPGENHLYVPLNEVHWTVKGTGNHETNRTAIAAAKKDGVLRYVPTGTHKRAYVPVKWAEGYLQKRMETFEKLGAGEEQIKKTWLTLQGVAEEFGLAESSIRDYVGRAHAATAMPPGPLNARRYVEPIPRIRVGRRMYFDPEVVRMMADRYKRKLSPDILDSRTD